MARAAEEGWFSGLFGIGDIMGSAVKGAAAWGGYMIMTVTSSVLGLAGYFFDAAIKYAITDAGIGMNSIIKDGWTLSRDVANLFFIFILLYISIATILQLAGYGVKDLLAKVIIIALLVNFSLVITNVIIDASNVLAVEFYSKVAGVKDSGGNIVGGIRDAAGNPVGLSAAVISGINPQSLFDSSPLFGKKMDDGTTKQLETNGTLMQIITITFMGSALILIAAFVLFAAGIMFVIRTVVLWILMILSPLAFVAMALPRTKQYASDWWSKLFNQAFFAPAYLFLFYFTIKIITQGGIIRQAIMDNYSLGSGLADPDPVNVKLILNFVLIIVLMLATLTIAKTLGGASAETGLKWANNAKKWGKGYAGRVSKRYTAPAARQLIEGKGRFARTLRKVPLAPRVLAKASVADEPEISKYMKQYSSYSPAALAAIRREPKITLNRAQLAALEKLKEQEEEKTRKKAEKARRKKILEEGTDFERMAALIEEAEETAAGAEEVAEKAGSAAEKAASAGAAPKA